MASSTTVETPLQSSNTSENNYSCTSNVALKFGSGERENENKVRMSKCCVSRRISVQRKPTVHRQESILHCQTHKSYHGRRRFTFSGHQEHKVPFKRRRRINSIVLPTKFLLGGNINDPLNLQSLADEEVSRRLNAITPESSPLPTPRHKTQVQVLIPPNINDPLNLNTGEEIEFNLISPRTRKRKRHRKSKKEEHEVSKDLSLDLNFSNSKCAIETATLVKSFEECASKELKSHMTSTPQVEERAITDKIVSPVVPQGSPSKFYKRFHSKSIPRDADGEKSTFETKIFQRRRRSKSKGPQNVSDIKFKQSDEKFGFGNCRMHYTYNGENTDSRLKILQKKWFANKDVLDIGCNVGYVTLYVAENYEPKKIVGLDIDENLINIARKNAWYCPSASLRQNERFPISMALSYGSLARIPASSGNADIARFPKNVTFVQENYVLSSDESAEAQEPEYDTILCLRLTKWIHLNWGDEGLKRVFKRIFAHLRPGGRLIIETQAWPSYSAKKRISPVAYSNYYNIKFKPEKFNEYLLSIGFITCELIGRSFHPVKGYRQPIYLFTKGIAPPPIGGIGVIGLHSPFIFHSEDWPQASLWPQDNSDEQVHCGHWPEMEIASPNNSLTGPASPSENESENLSCELLACSPREIPLDRVLIDSFSPGSDEHQDRY